jgi:subtilisin-like proprotein convertase family protein
VKQGVIWLVPAGLGIVALVAVMLPGLGTSSAQDSCASYQSADTPLDIAPMNSTVVSTINVPESLTLSDVRVNPINITHSWVDDLDAYLWSPNGTKVELFTNVGNPPGGDDFVGTVLDDAAEVSMSNGVAPFRGPHRPEEPLAKFAGEGSAGEWRLEVTDTARPAEFGTLGSWALELCRVEAPGPSPAPEPTHTPMPTPIATPSPGPADTLSPPTNDNFADATVISGLPYSDSLSIAEATVEADEQPSSCGYHGNTVWYSFAPGQGGLVYITTFGSTYDTVIAAYTGSDFTDLVEAGCSDDTSAALTSGLELEAKSGTTYWIQIGMFTMTGQLNIELEWAETPANDSFAAALPASPPPYGDTLTTILATAEAGETLDCDGSLIGKSVWYNVNVAGPRVVTVTTEGSDYDTVLAVYTGKELTTLSQLACNDDAVLLSSEVQFLGVSGTIYWIQAGGFQGESGTLVLGVTQSSPPISDGDGDGLSDAAEVGCGSNASSASSVPERTDTVADDDEDGLTNEALPAGASAHDCDGDGYTGLVEGHVTTSDQDPCGDGGWPSDILPSGAPANTLNIQDLASFLAPVRRFGTSAGHPGYSARWDFVPGSAVGANINIADIAATVMGPSGFPPMFGGYRAYGRACPWVP